MTRNDQPEENSVAGYKYNQLIPTASLPGLALSYVVGVLSHRIKRLANRSQPGGYPRVFDYGSHLPGPNKRALLIYLTEPFHISSDDPRMRRHQNRWQRLEIAKILNRLGYVIDVIHHRDVAFVPHRNYDVVFGIHPGFDRIVGRLDRGTTKIYYAVEMPWQFQNAAVKSRYDSLTARRGLKLKYRRLVTQHESLDLADYVIYMGDDFTLREYSKLRPDESSLFFRVPNTAPEVSMANLKEKNFEQARRRFLFLGSDAFVLRGLDRVLDAFKEFRECELYVCANLWPEVDFCYGYRRELFGLPNVFPVGWVDIESDLFRSIVARCAFSIYPSGSECCSGSVLSSLANGLIPIASRQCTVAGMDTGMMLEDCEVGTIKKALRTASQLSVAECQRRARESLATATKEFSREAFRERMYRVLKDILEQ